MSDPILIPNEYGVHWDVSALQHTIGKPQELSGRVYPVCPDDQTPMNYNSATILATVISCPACHKQLDLKPNTIHRIQTEITQKFIRLKNQKANFLDLDGQLTPVIKPKKIKIDDRFAVEVALKRSRRGGHQLVIYVFDKD
jgi:hypothetical protein